MSRLETPAEALQSVLSESWFRSGNVVMAPKPPPPPGFLPDDVSHRIVVDCSGTQDGRGREIVRATVCAAAPAAVRLALELGPLLAEVLAARDGGALVVNAPKVREFIALRDQVIAELEGRS